MEALFLQAQYKIPSTYNLKRHNTHLDGRGENGHVKIPARHKTHVNIFYEP